MKACFQIAECCLAYANIAFLSEKNISFKYYYKKIRGFYYVFLQKVRGFPHTFYKKVRGVDKSIVAAPQSGHDFHKMRIKIWQLLLVNHCLLFLSYNMAFCQETM